MILEEGNQPYPRCPQCEMFVSHKTLNGRHMTTALCQRGAKRKWLRLAEEEERAGAETAFTSDGIPLAPVTSFKYLGQILTKADDDWPSVVRNLRKARRKWVWLTRVLGREGADARILGQIYLAVVQSVMLYGSDTWVMTPRIYRMLGGFHHRVAQRLTERQPWKGRDGVLT